MLGIIGSGNMGKALIKGYDIKNVYKRGDYNITDSDIIFIAVKPKDYDEVLKGIKKYTKDKIIIILALGYSINKALSILGEESKVVRIMPNLSVSLKEGISAIAYSKNIDKKDEKRIEEILKEATELYHMDEKDFPAFTAISASLPAYVYIMVEALSDGAVYEGLKRQDSYEIIKKSMISALKLIDNTNPAILKDKITSPKGSTIEAVKALEKGNIRNTLMEAVIECTKKAK